MDKLQFTNFVTHTIIDHPEWLADTLYAMQSGVTMALAQEREHTANVSYALSWMIEHAPKVAQKERKYIYNGLLSLKSFFTGAKFEKQIDDLLKEDSDN